MSQSIRMCDATLLEWLAASRGGRAVSNPLQIVCARWRLAQMRPHPFALAWLAVARVKAVHRFAVTPRLSLRHECIIT